MKPQFPAHELLKQFKSKLTKNALITDFLLHPTDLISEFDLLLAHADRLAELLREADDRGYLKAKVTGNDTQLDKRTWQALQAHRDIRGLTEKEKI